MDGDDRRASHYGPPYQPGSSRPPAGPSMGPPTTDRFAQPATPVRIDPTRPSLVRPYMSSYSGYGYQEQQYGTPPMQGSSPMHGVEMQYPPAYVQDVSRQQGLGQSQSHQPYGQFPHGSMLPSTPQPQMYETMPQYQQRQSAAIEVMSSQLGQIPQYMQQGEQAGLRMPSAATNYGSSQAEQTQHPATTVQRGALPSQYSQEAVDYGVVEERQSQQPTQPPPPSAAEQEALLQEFRQYELHLRTTFEDIIAGRVTDASEKIIGISRWLVGSVVPLGLHHDEDSRYEERINLWRQINLCWEALGQKQKDLTVHTLRTGRQPADILAAETIKRLVDDVVSMCDQLEGYGLVDYEMGIAEEQICHIFTLCLNLLQRDEQDTQSAQPPNPPSHT